MGERRGRRSKEKVEGVAEVVRAGGQTIFEPQVNKADRQANRGGRSRASAEVVGVGGQQASSGGQSR